MLQINYIYPYSTIVQFHCLPSFLETDPCAVPGPIVQDELPSNPQACSFETSSSNSIQVDKTTPSTVSVMQFTKSRYMYAVAASAKKGDAPSDSGQENIEKQRELVESMFPGEKVNLLLHLPVHTLWQTLLRLKEWKQTCDNYQSILTTPQTVSLCTLRTKKSRSKLT